MSVVTRSDDSSVRRRSSGTPKVMMIGASSGVPNLRGRLLIFDEPRYDARMYLMPDIWLWRFIATLSTRLFGLVFGSQIRRFSEVVRKEYPRNCKVVLMIHKDSVADVVCAVARKLVRQEEILESEISILLVPSPSRCRLTVDDVKRIALRHRLPMNIPVEEAER